MYVTYKECPVYILSTGYVRIALSFVCFYYLYTEPGICVVTYLLSHYLDEWDGWFARKYNQGRFQ